ncbi:ion transporter [Candidatus Brachybacter algidus]|uniref:ion transporter n=1 Tax=Candidatus Brachybacter algidus TaxID=2982024 RepID=UPI001DEEE0B6|nr:ion transporter [Candidatus Brachybacter algidus]MBK6447546.1 ion transporter [Candidatus Brachybacter algidus]
MSIYKIIPDRIDVVQSQNRPEDEKSWQYKLYVIIFQANTPAGKIFDTFLFFLILSNIALLLAESVESYSAKYGHIFQQLDMIFMVIFSIEYILRLMCVRSKRVFAKSIYGVIDLLAILPSFVEFFIPNTHMLMIIRSFRLLRVFRIFRMVKFLDESRDLVFSLVRSSRKIAIFLFFMLVLTFFLGSVMYVIEYDHNPSFSSIPQSIYWAIVTITTVGYGDISPLTPMGKVLASFIMILGYAIIAVPTGIIGSNLIKEMKYKKNDLVCQNCNLVGHEDDAVYCRRCGNELKHKME